MGIHDVRRFVKQCNLESSKGAQWNAMVFANKFYPHLQNFNTELLAEFNFFSSSDKNNNNFNISKFASKLDFEM